MLNKKKPKPAPKTETIFDYERRLKQEAKIIAEKHKDVKPVKYFLK